MSIAAFLSGAAGAPTRAAPPGPATTRIEDLFASPGAGDGEASLSWTAPDNGSGGAVDSYEVKWSIYPLINSNADHDAATTFSQSLTPKTPGLPETLTVTGLEPGQTVQFSVRPIVSAALADWAVSAASRITGADIPDLTGSTEITSLPFTANVPGGKYHLAQNLSSTTTGVTIAADNIILNLGDFTITPNTSNGAGNPGIIIAAANARVTNGKVLHGGGTTSTGNHGISWVGGTYASARIDHMEITTVDRNSYPIYAIGGGLTGTFKIDHNTLNAGGDTSDRRDPGTGAVWILGTDITCNIHHNTVIGTQQWAFYLNNNDPSGAPTLIHHNRITGTVIEFENGYMYQLRNSSNIRVYEEWCDGQSRGFHADESDNIHFHDSYLRSSVKAVRTLGDDPPPTGNYWTHGIRPEIATNSDFYDNHIEVYLDTECNLCQALNVSVTSTTANVRVFGNRFIATKVGGTHEDAVGITWEFNPAGTQGQDTTPAPKPNTVIDWNVVSSRNYLLKHVWQTWNFGEVRYTIWRRIDAASPYAYLRYENSPDRYTTGYIQDSIFDGTTADDASQQASNLEYQDDRAHTLSIKVVNDANGQPISGATVTVTNQSGAGTQQFTGPTDAEGFISGPCKWQHVRHPTVTKTDFNDQRINVVAAGFQNGDVDKTVNSLSYVEVRMRTAAVPLISDITTAPDQPANAKAHPTSALRIRVFWDLVTNVPIYAYKVLVDDEVAKIVPPTDTGCHVQVPAAATAYNIKLIAISANEVESTALDLGSITTRPEDRGV